MNWKSKTGQWQGLDLHSPDSKVDHYGMRLTVCILLVFLLAYPVSAKQKRTRAKQHPQRLSRTTGVAKRTAVINFTELVAQEALNPKPSQEIRLVEKPREEEFAKTPIPKGASVIAQERAIEAVQSLGPSPPLSASFQGSPGDGALPPDTQGAAGPNHLVGAVNGVLRVQTKTGTTIGVVREMLDFFAPVSDGFGSAFDPQLQYDPYGNRWILVASAFRGLVIAVSQTDDPTGNWNLFGIPADSAGRYWIDYPRLGFNKNWIVVAATILPLDPDGVVRPDVFVFNKANLYANGSAAFTRFNLTNADGYAIRPATTLDPNLETMYLLQNWQGNSNGVGSLRMYTITGSVGSEVLNNVATPLFITTTNTWSNFGLTSGNGAPQLGSTAGLSLNGSDIQNVVYRNGSLWCVQTIFLPADGDTTRSAVQWWEILPGGMVRQQGRLEDPTGNIFYGFPSIAVNKNNDVLIGYARFSATQYAGAGYAFRAGSDPLNAIRDDTVLKAGENAYFFSSRWGDYSASSVDPVNDVEMWTTQEYAGSHVNTWNTWWGRVTPAQATPTPTPTPTPSPSPGPGSSVVTNTNDSGTGSLREVISDAPEGSTITFSLPAGSNILLTSGELSITKSLTIAGPGANVLTVGRSPLISSQFRVFHVRSGNLNVAISGLTISDGSANTGAGIEIESSGTVNVTACAVTGNSAGLTGGGIDSAASGALNISYSTISNNNAGYGGGIYVQGPTLNLTNSTISGNSAQNGGGLNSQQGTTNIVNATIVRNSAPFGGGLYIPSGSVNSRNSIIAVNSGATGPDIFSASFNFKLTSQGYNLIGNDSGAIIISQATDQTGTSTDPIDPLLGQLADNGGPTKTHALLAGSLAIDKGGPMAGITTDQRGLQRPVESASAPNAAGGDSSDIGAFEVQLVTSSPLQLILDQTGPAPDQVAALDSVLLLRDPFPLVNTVNLFNKNPDRNTRVMIFAANLQLAQGETAASVIVNIIDKNSQSYDIAAEDVRFLSNSSFVQIIFRLPDSLPVGTCTLRIKAHDQISNAGTMRILNQ